MMKRVIGFTYMIMLLLTVLVSCGHEHEWSEWKTLKDASCTEKGVRERVCECGEVESQELPLLDHREGSWIIDVNATCTKEGSKHQVCSVCNTNLKTEVISALGHAEVKDAAVAATCITNGLTEGSHCQDCNEVFKKQESVSALGHAEVTDAAVSATCTATGLTEGKHCSVCNSIIAAQAVVPKLSHNYTKETITKEATCLSKGFKSLECNRCSNKITQEYELTKYTATEINAEALNYVGEIVVYDKSGKELGLATGFVYSKDGKIITNYHVIDGAYSAKITINNKTYKISKVLAYDSNIDLAVLQVDATFDNYATVCKNEIAVGSTVYAIGSSRGMTNTFSQGIITYYNRVVDGVSHIQHDASITNGNSGGPLINEYGEVVGINTWGLADSQNLNFAVFTKEIDNLKFGTAMTMAQFYEATFNPYEKLKEWVIDHYNNEGNSWIAYDYKESDEYYSVFSITYYYESDYLTITHFYVFDNYDSRFMSIKLAEDPTKCLYYATYTDGDYSYQENTTTGYINATKFTPNSSLTYNTYEGTYWTQSSILKTYKEAAVVTVDWFDWALRYYGIGLTIEDFGFKSFN